MLSDFTVRVQSLYLWMLSDFTVQSEVPLHVNAVWCYLESSPSYMWKFSDFILRRSAFTFTCQCYLTILYRILSLYLWMLSDCTELVVFSLYLWMLSDFTVQGSFPLSVNAVLICTSNDISMLEYLLQKRATSAFCSSVSCRSAFLSSSSISSKMLSIFCRRGK